MNNPKRREELATSRAAADYVIEAEFLEESSLGQQARMGTIAILTLTAVPVPFDWEYTISATVSKGGARVGQSWRRATLSNWVEAFLIFAYPGYPLEGKREEIVLRSEATHEQLRELAEIVPLRGAAQPFTRCGRVYWEASLIERIRRALEAVWSES